MRSSAFRGDGKPSAVRGVQQPKQVTPPVKIGQALSCSAHRKEMYPKCATLPKGKYAGLQLLGATFVPEPVHRVLAVVQPQ